MNRKGMLSKIGSFCADVVTGDVARLLRVGDSGRRIAAIASVSYREALRRRVLLIVPLALLGVILIAQLQRPLDEQDAIRGTVKYCLFAAGALVFLVTIILACTNLPRDIETRVIYTIVTKPTTRLEIVLGKILGFAGVSALILLIMGAFTLGYVHLRAAVLEAGVRSRLATLAPSETARPSLEHYATHGLLQAKEYVRPATLQAFAHPPGPNDAQRWISSSGEQSFLVPFDLPADLFSDVPGGPPSGGDDERSRIVVMGNIRYRRVGQDEALHPTPFPGKVPDPRQFGGFQLHRLPFVSISILGPDQFALFPQAELKNHGNIELPPSGADAQYEDLIDVAGGFIDRVLPLDPERRRIWVNVSAASSRAEYAVSPDTILLRSPRLAKRAADRARAEHKPVPPDAGIVRPAPDPETGRPSWPVCRGRIGSGGQLLPGVDPSRHSSPLAVFAFSGAGAVARSADGTVGVELRFGIEGTGEDPTASSEGVARASLQVYNRKTGRLGQALVLPVEVNRTAFASVPPEDVEGGEFDVRVQCLTRGHYLVLHGPTASVPAVRVVTAAHGFAANLAKSLLVLWLLSVLVIIVSIFCSTFVSWPIAVVLTMVILLSRWGVTQMGEAMDQTLGRQVAMDMKLRDPGQIAVVQSGVNALTSTLRTVSDVLPDIGAFAAMEDIERGVWMPGRVLRGSGRVILVFGLPMMALAYLVLKGKEVAP